MIWPLDWRERAGGGLFTVWFIVMALLLLVSERFKISYGHLPWLARATTNIFSVVVCFIIARKING
jgi:hypothetical protein